MYLLNNRRKWFVRRRPEGAAIPMSECEIAVETPVQYTGIALYPPVVVKYGDDVLVRDVDYALTYKDNVNLGNGTVTVTGIGAFTGRVVKTFAVKDMGGATWDFNIADATFVNKVRPTNSYQMTRLFGSVVEPEMMYLFVSDFLQNRFASVYGIPKDDAGEFHLENIGQEVSHGVSAAGNPFIHPKVLSPDGLGIVWASGDDNGATSVQTTMSSFSDFSSQSVGDTSSSIDSNVCIVGGGSSNVAYIEGGMKAVVFCIRSAPGSSYQLFAVKFDLSRQNDFSSVIPSSAVTVNLPFSTSFNSVCGIVVSRDGKNVLFSHDTKIRQFRMSVNFDFSSLESVGELDLPSSARGLVVTSDVKTLFFATSDGHIHEYALNR